MATIYYGVNRQEAANNNSVVQRASGVTTGRPIELVFDDTGINKKDLLLALRRFAKFLEERTPADVGL